MTIERMTELIKRAVEFSYDERNPPDVLLTKEAVDATSEEFSALIDLLNRIPDCFPDLKSGGGY